MKTEVFNSFNLNDFNPYISAINKYNRSYGIFKILANVRSIDWMGNLIFYLVRAFYIVVDCHPLYWYSLTVVRPLNLIWKISTLRLGENLILHLHTLASTFWCICLWSVQEKFIMVLVCIHVTMHCIKCSLKQ